MTTATLRISIPLPEAKAAPKKSFLMRFFDAMAAARMKQAMIELERHRHLIPPHLLRNAGTKSASDDGAW